MSAVHASKGPLDPASDQLRSEVDIVCSLALATLGGEHGIPWGVFRADYRDHPAADRPRGARLCGVRREGRASPAASRCRTRRATRREFPTETGKAIFSASPLEVLEVPEGHLLLQTLRSHDQFNTTIYGLDDRYRGIKNGRRVVFVHPDDIEHLGWQDGDHVDLVSVWHDGSERCATEFRIVSYDQPRGCAAAYYPETNPLVPLDSKAEGSNTPTSKSVIIRLEKPAGRRTGVITQGDGHEVGHKRATNARPSSRSTCREQPRGQTRRARCASPGAARGIEVMTPREVPLGGPRAMTVRRTLPQRERSLIGAWCFLDHYGPDHVADSGGMSVAPHPHTGLQTVSWLFTGEIEHRDSAGHHAMVRPGELNLMTAGHGISHSEVSTPETTVLHGAQLWVALPDVGPRRRPDVRALRARRGDRRRLGGPGLPRLAARRHLAGRDRHAAARRRAAARAPAPSCTSTSTRRSSTASWSTPASSRVGDVETKQHELAYLPPGSQRLTLEAVRRCRGCCCSAARRSARRS